MCDCNLYILTLNNIFKKISEKNMFSACRLVRQTAHRLNIYRDCQAVQKLNFSQTHRLLSDDIKKDKDVTDILRKQILYFIFQGCIKFLVSWGGGPSCLFWKNIMLWTGEGNIRAVRKNITLKKGEAVSFDIWYWGWRGRKSDLKKNKVEEEYQVVWNFLRPCYFHTMSTNIW